jgi:outer membrane immunogenic protein
MKRLATAIAAIALIGAPAFAATAKKKKAPPPRPPAPVPVYSWTGFYGGVNAGWSWGKDKGTVSSPGPLLQFRFSPPTPPIPPVGFAHLAAIDAQESNRADGAIGGVQVGYNWQATPTWILGIEADIQASGEGASANHESLFSATGGAPPATLTVSQSLSHNDSLLWFGTVRGRIGYAFWPTVMFYGTGGLAYGRLNDSISATFTAIGALGGVTSSVSNFDVSTTKAGWTVGGGIEGAVPNTHVTWKIENLYMDLGTRNYTFTNVFVSVSPSTLGISSHFTDNILRVGLNYQFH